MGSLFYVKQVSQYREKQGFAKSDSFAGLRMSTVAASITIAEAVCDREPGFKSRHIKAIDIKFRGLTVGPIKRIDSDATEHLDWTSLSSP